MKIENLHIASLSILMFLFSLSDIQAQLKDYKYRFVAKVMAADTTVFIHNCHIINKTQHLVTVSDEFGGFTITANVGDSIMFSMIGYERLTIVARDSMYTNNRIVKLIPAVYFLSEVDIGILSTYDRFKRDILSKEAAEAYKMAPLVNKYDVYITPLPNQGGFNIPFTASPITFLYNLWSKEGKQYEYYQSVIRGTAEFIIIGAKFNGLIVKELTGLENDELLKFMSFCRFTRPYLLATSEMEIRRAIMYKFKEYLNEQR